MSETLTRYIAVDGDDESGDTLRIVTVEDIADDIREGHYHGDGPMIAKLWTIVASGSPVRCTIARVKEEAPYPERESDTWWMYWTYEIRAGEVNPHVFDTFTVRINGDA